MIFSKTILLILIIFIPHVSLRLSVFIIQEFFVFSFSDKDMLLYTDSFFETRILILVVFIIFLLNRGAVII